MAKAPVSKSVDDSVDSRRTSGGTGVALLMHWVDRAGVAFSRDTAARNYARPLNSRLRARNTMDGCLIGQGNQEDDHE